MRYLLPLALLVPFLQFSQTGAGGVGSSASNILWLDANSGVSVTGSAVTGWTDRSGNGNSPNPPSVAARPTLVSSSVNGYPSIDFDGTDDELRITDAASIDLTAWHFFMVVTIDNHKNYNSWLIKGDDGTENYELLSYGVAPDAGNVHTPIYFTNTTRGFLNGTAGSITTTSFDIIEYSYSSAVGRDIYKNFSSIGTDNVALTPQTNNRQLYIGNERSTTGRFLNGDIAEIVGYNAVQNTAGRTIINNYLSAKYNITLSSGDVYAGDLTANGDFDHDVAGIGQSSTGNTSTMFSTSVGGGLGMTYVSGFNDGDYIMAGHNLKTGNMQQPNDVGGMTGTNNARWSRVWYVDVTNTSTDIVADVVFDLSDGGATATPATASNYVILYRATNSGNWTELATGSSIAGDRITFSSVTLSNDGFYTIGTKNFTTSPLPIELLSFNAVPCGPKVCISWETASELNNDYFTIERSADGVNFEALSQHATKAHNGNSNSKLDYDAKDLHPLKGTSYYRLRQTDISGSFTHSNVATVQNDESGNALFSIYPNPNSGEFYVDFSGFENNHTVEITLYDLEGKLIYNSSVTLNEINQGHIKIVPDVPLSNGTYICNLVLEGIRYQAKVVVQ